MEFRWNDWNVEHIGKHGVHPYEAESVVRNARTPYPVYAGDGKLFVWGRTGAGRLLQVVYVLDENWDVFVIHARQLSWREKQQFNRRRRRRGTI